MFLKSLDFLTLYSIQLERAVSNAPSRVGVSPPHQRMEMVCFLVYLNTGQWTKSKNPAIPSDIQYQFQNSEFFEMKLKSVILIFITILTIFFQVSHFESVLLFVSSSVLSMWLCIAFYMSAPLLCQLHQAAVSLHIACVHNMM
jgi:hypothetical protein